MLRQVATAATMSAAVLEAMRMALHALEERRSVSDKMGWEGSTLLRPAAELAAIAAMSILIGMPLLLVPTVSLAEGALLLRHYLARAAAPR